MCRHRGAGGAYDWSNEVYYSRYPGTRLTDQSIIDATSDLQLDNVAFDADAMHVPTSYSYALAQGRFWNPAYYNYNYYYDPLPDFKIAANLAESYEVCGARLRAGGSGLPISGKVEVCCDASCSSSTLLHTWNVDESAYGPEDDDGFQAYEFQFDNRGSGQYFRFDFDAVAPADSQQYKIASFELFQCLDVSGRRLQEAPVARQLSEASGFTVDRYMPARTLGAGEFESNAARCSSPMWTMGFPCPSRCSAFAFACTGRPP